MVILTFVAGAKHFMISVRAFSIVKGCKLRCGSSGALFLLDTVWGGVKLNNKVNS